jgi:hypothetical protein
MNDEKVCRLCARPISQHADDTEDCLRHAIRRIEALEHRAATLVKTFGEPGKCRGCGADIFWLTTFRNGKAAPYDATGVTHFASCPSAAQFKKQPAKQEAARG